MTRRVHGGLARARVELGGARVLAENGFGDAAVSRAFRAAETALLVLGETRAEHSEVVSAFVRRVVRERSLDPRAGRLLRSLYNRRALADHSDATAPAAEARAALDDAAFVLDAVEAWLAEPALSTPPAPENGATRRPEKPVRRGSRA
ncbi:HEPN domain-containing protein [Pseudonocardia sp. ICBG1142]|uniref:HEPN domain-containing protein n=1 Tax=Pseudonocardia sp. ICBG1142 TaxID=2846760 RepID=UPI001CF70EB7|nr:HEPN domain-containing protein [Pseudonocardia sp. ICBG1142]